MCIALPLLAACVAASKLVPSEPAVTRDYAPYGGKNAKILKSPADWNRNTYPIFVHCA